MKLTHIHDAGQLLMFRQRIEAVVNAAGRRHLAELRRTWQTPQHINRSAAQRRRWANHKGSI